MIALALALGLSLAAPSDSDLVAVADSASRDSILATAPDSQELAKLEAIQRAWDGDSARQRAPASAPRVGSLLAQLVASLAVLLGLAGFALLLVRRIRQKSKSGTKGGGSLLDLLETRSLGQGNHLTLVRIHDRVVAVGHGPGGVNTLAEFQGNDAARILAESGDGAVSVRDFTATLDTFLDRFRTAPAPAKIPEDRP
jgi:flagellar biogenesis protein FliO